LLLVDDFVAVWAASVSEPAARVRAIVKMAASIANIEDCG
jgi:hypothetical protein